MEASPVSPFEVGEAEFALEFVIIAFDAPAKFRSIGELRSVCPQAGSRASISSARARPRAIRSATIRADAGLRVSSLARPAEKSGSGWSPRARTRLAKPPAAAPSPASWPRPADARRRAARARACAASDPGLGRQRLLAGRPDGDRRLHADRIGQAHRRASARYPPSEP